jgi:hypothetical protein
MVKKHSLRQECQVTMASRFRKVVPNICGSKHGIYFTSSFWHLEFRWLLQFGKICASLADNNYINFSLNYYSSQTIFINCAMFMWSYLEQTYISSLNAPYIKKTWQKFAQGNDMCRDNKRTVSKWKLLNISSPKRRST